MKKRSLLLLLWAALALPSAAQNTPTYCMLTNAGDSIDATQVDYLVASAESRTDFDVVMKGGRVYARVTSLTPVATATAIRTVKATEAGVLSLNGGRIVVQSPVAGRTLSVCTLDGRLLRSFRLDAGRQTVDITTLPAGVYILKTDQSVVKFIKK